MRLDDLIEQLVILLSGFDGSDEISVNRFDTGRLGDLEFRSTAEALRRGVRIRSVGQVERNFDGDNLTRLY